jgi:RNA polymerase sigma-70 factor
MSLALDFERHAAIDCRPEQRGGLERALEAALRRARQAHPGIAVGDANFVEFVARRVDATDDVDLLCRRLERMSIEDLYLCCGCQHGDGVACRRFFARCATTVSGVLRGLRLPAERLEEVQGLVFERLFLVGESGRPPKIGCYLGEGDLSAWVKVVTVRLLLNLLRQDGRQRLDLDAELVERAADRSDDPADLRYMKAMYRGQFRRAFRYAVQQLSPRQRNVLRYQLLDEMSAAEIAKVYRVHRATVFRWQKEIQSLLLHRTRDHLQQQLDLDRKELDSIVRLIQSSWDVGVSGILRTHHPTCDL